MDARPGKGEGRKSRDEAFTAEEAAGTPRSQLVMPPIDGGAEHFFYLVDHLMRVGPDTNGEVLTFSEISAWSGLNSYDLHGWEAEILRGLSSAYLAEHQAAAEIKRPPPFAPAAPVIDRSLVSARILAMYKKMAAEDAERT